MLVSIIIPVYNVAKYLRDCVHSVQCQTHKEIEILLVDDGSTDDSGLICERLATEDEHIKVVHQTNQGLSAARNTGINHATGEYLAFLDGDDEYLLADGLQRLVRKAEETYADIILFQGVDVYPNRQGVRQPYDINYIENHPPMEVFGQLVATQSFQMSACFQLLRRDYIISNRLYFEIGLLSEDVDWSLRLWQRLNMVCALNIPMYGYKHRSGSITTTYTLRNLQSYDAIFLKFGAKYHEEVGQDADYWNIALGYLAQMYTSCLYTYGQIQRKDRKRALEILKKHVWLLDYSISKKSNRVVRIKRYIGLSGAVFVFSVYGKMKRFLWRHRA